MDHYIYSPLVSEPGRDDAMRILKVLPGCGDEPLKCAMENTYLSDCINFEVLFVDSGHSGIEDERGDSRIACDHRFLPATTPLRAALSHLRKPAESRNLWVQALCVNQCVDDERGRQIRLMRDIFPKAERLLIWLGDGVQVEHEGDSKRKGLSAASI